MSISVEQVNNPDEDAHDLVTELEHELSGIYSCEERHGLSIEQLLKPHVQFFIARLNGLAVGCGGIAFEEGLAEIKRMYVRPSARRKKVAQAILAHLEGQARLRKSARLVLETGDAQLAAIRLYEQCGFVRCAAFGDYARMLPDAIRRSIFFEKQLA